MFLLAALLLMLYATLIRGKIDMIMSVLFVCLYLVYVVFVLLQDRFFKPLDNQQAA